MIGSRGSLVDPVVHLTAFSHELWTRINPFTLSSLPRALHLGEVGMIVGSSCPPSHRHEPPSVSADGNGNDFGETSLLVIALAFPSGTKIRDCSLLTYFRDRICYLCLSFFVPPSPFHLSLIDFFLFTRPISLGVTYATIVERFN